MVYCDYIAHRIQEGLRNDTEKLLDRASPTKYDLDSVGGWLKSTRKEIRVTDRHGKSYRITVEEE